jgi:ADP-heptose:LPS heptosyltransferase
MVILISLRGFGDAVILRTTARRIACGKPPGFVQVITTKRYSKLFVEDINIKLHILSAGTTLQSGFSINSNLLKDLLTLWEIRKLEIDQSIDFTGDIRERVIGLLIGAKKHFFPKWKRGHPAGDRKSVV